MDWDLWAPPDDPESSIYMQPEWIYNSCFGCGSDVIEEDALNEKCCIQVLRVLITKADTEIDELEQDLLSLQSELAWVENEEWTEICSNALREKINCLEISVMSLRNKDKNDLEVHLLMHTQPVEQLHEILKALLSNYSCKKDEQSKEAEHATTLNSSSVVPSQTTNIVDEDKTLGDCSSESIMRESSSTTEHAAILDPSLKLDEKKTYDPRTVKVLAKATDEVCVAFERQAPWVMRQETLSEPGVKDSNSHSMKLADGHSDEEILSSYCCPENISKGENRGHDLSPKDGRMIKNSSSTSSDKGRANVETIKLQPTDVAVSNSISGASEHPVGNSDKKKKYSDPDSIIVSDEVEEHNPTSKDDVILGSSLKSVVKKTDASKKVKLANATVTDLGLTASRHTTADSNEMKILCNSNTKVSGNEDYCSRATGKSKISSSLSPEGKGNHPRKNKFAGTVVKNVSAGELRCASGLHVRLGNADSGLGTCSSNPEIEQKLSDLSLEAASKQTMEELKVAALETVVPCNSPPKTQGKEKNPTQILKVVEAALTETENSALTSLLELQDKKGITAIMLLPKEEGKAIPEVNMSEIDADEKNSDLELSHNFHTEKAKMIIKPNTPVIQEIGFSTMVVDSSSSFVSEGKKQEKSVFIPLNATLNQDHKIKKIVLQLAEYESKENGASPVDSPKSVSQPQKRRKRSATFPIIAEAKDSSIQMDISDSKKDTINCSNMDDQLVIESCSIHDSSSVTVASMPSASVLEKMKLADLRNIAKKNKLTKYYKLSKKELLQLLASKVGKC